VITLAVIALIGLTCVAGIALLLAYDWTAERRADRHNTDATARIDALEAAVASAVERLTDLDHGARAAEMLDAFAEVVAQRDFARTRCEEIFTAGQQLKVERDVLAIELEQARDAHPSTDDPIAAWLAQVGPRTVDEIAAVWALDLDVALDRVHRAARREELAPVHDAGHRVIGWRWLPVVERMDLHSGTLQLTRITLTNGATA
jgi:cell division protein FtsB